MTFHGCIVRPWTFSWQAGGCPFWLLSVSVQVYCNEYGK